MAELREELPVGTFPTVPRQQRAQEKRRALLESGRVLFASQGYNKTTAKEIARHAGVAVGTFYRYFSDKRQLLLALLKGRLDSVVPAGVEWLLGDPEQAIQEVLERRIFCEDGLGLEMAFEQLVAGDPELAATFAQSTQAAQAAVGAIVRQAKDQGLTWPDIDPEIAAWTIISLVEQAARSERAVTDPAWRKHLARSICRFIVPPEALQRLQRPEGT